MKRAERHHLKENELEKFARQAREAFQARQRGAMAALVVVGVISVVAIGYWAWREREQTRAHALLADAIAVQSARVGPPAATGAGGTPSFATERDRSAAALTKFKAAADAYPLTDTGLFAGYQEASTLMVLGRAPEAATAYQRVIDRSAGGLYGQMARLGLAEAQARAGQYDQAITAFKELAQRKDGPLPIDGILMQLGRTYRDAGKRSDAQQTFNRLVEEYPESPFTGEAKRELDSLKKT